MGSRVGDSAKKTDLHGSRNPLVKGITLLTEKGIMNQRNNGWCVGAKHDTHTVKLIMKAKGVVMDD